VNSVILPSDITYQGLPISQENASPQTLANNSVVQFLILTFEIIIHPEILSIILVITLVFVIIALIPKKKKARARYVQKIS
jgi:hypothetical protein